MLTSLLAISEFATKLVAGLSGVIFAALIMGLAFGIKNRKPKNINPDEIKRKAALQPEQTEQKSKKSKNKKGSDKSENADESVGKPSEKANADTKKSDGEKKKETTPESK